MTLLVDAGRLDARTGAARGPLAPLAASLRADLDRVLAASVEVPRVKALLSRDGGRCPRDGSALAFDPFSPHAHRCPVCDAEYRGERHDRWWTIFQQQWIAERAVHAALLHAVSGEPTLADFARRVLEESAAQYLAYPNRDNVLGPSRPFFSTYLESIWLLQLCIALDLLETRDAAQGIGGRLRERLVAPSAELIASFDERGSNRQVWNDAALLAAGRLLGREEWVERAVRGRSGLIDQLSCGLLPDGTWYEGENYHFFAHRGLWYSITMAEHAGIEVPPALRARFEEAFATPLLSALPDFTFPSRRDSPYGVSLRQWRFAESCELGLARRDDARLIGALYTLYRSELPRRDTGRWRSAAESERNEPPGALDRTDLGWRSLLFARAELPPLVPVPPRSALLESQGLAVLRREEGRVYVALDYGQDGGGHGHPDRLNVLLAHGAERWLDDPGTGSYVDPTLHWYRSTLAHDAPLVNGRSQQRVSGVLRAWDERGGVGWVSAAVSGIALDADVTVERSLVAMPDYVVDELRWRADRDVRFELPLHVAADARGLGPWRAAPLAGGAGEEDGFAFVHDGAVASAPACEPVSLGESDRFSGAAWVISHGASEWWRGIAPASPGQGDRRFYVVRSYGRAGGITGIWSWSGAVREVVWRDGAVTVVLADGSRHEHAPGENAWQVELETAGARSAVDLAGARRVTAAPSPPPRGSGPRPVEIHALPTFFTLRRDQYRRSEESWEEAGRPEADISVDATADELRVEITVRKTPLVFRPADAVDPALDNEHPDIHSDGLQFYLARTEWAEPAAWLVVPERGRAEPRVRTIAGARADVPLAARWEERADGYAVTLAVPREALRDGHGAVLALSVVVNDMAPGRERRRGQLALGAAPGEWVYLRGDREVRDAYRFVHLPAGPA